MGSQSNDAALAEASAFTKEIAERWWAEFKGQLIGIYRIGSLAHGGFSARYSDIDIAVIAAAPLASVEVERMRAMAAETSIELSAKLSIFWADRAFRAGRFPPLDRIDYLDYAVAIVERERIRPARPPLSEVRDYLRGEPLRRWATQIRYFNKLSALASSDQKPYLRTLLYPARFLYSWTTGAMAANDDAVEFLRHGPVPALDIGLIERALECRQENRDLDPIFPERSRLDHQYEACVNFISRG
jgi:predicted nucleotidyltransferase